MSSHKLYGVIQLPEPCGPEEVNIAVQVIDASVMDVCAPVLAETRFALNAHGELEIPFTLEAPPSWRLDGRDIRIVAEVLASRSGSVAEGDTSPWKVFASSRGRARSICWRFQWRR